MLAHSIVSSSNLGTLQQTTGYYRGEKDFYFFPEVVSMGVAETQVVNHLARMAFRQYSPCLPVPGSNTFEHYAVYTCIQLAAKTIQVILYLYPSTCMSSKW